MNEQLKIEMLSDFHLLEKHELLKFHIEVLMKNEFDQQLLLLHDIDQLKILNL